MSKKYVFLMVSLVDELEKVKISIEKIEKLYDVFKFSVVVPEKDINTFAKKLKFNRKVEIINEDKIVKKKSFFELCDKYLDKKKGFNSFRKGWYYQQVLKLTYSLDNKFFTNHNLVMWDADTIPLNKIKFFNKRNEPISYGSFYEYHKPYFEFDKIIFGKSYKPLSFAATIQFYAMNIEDREDLRNFLKKFNKKYKIPSSKIFIGNTILKAIEMKDNSLPVNGQLVSEQEIIGAFIFQKYKRKKENQKIIKFFRFDVDGYLNIFQRRILYLLNYKHITYEWHYKLKKNQSYLHLFKSIIRDFIISNYNDYKKFNKIISRVYRFYSQIKLKLKN